LGFGSYLVLVLVLRWLWNCNSIWFVFVCLFFCRYSNWIQIRIPLVYRMLKYLVCWPVCFLFLLPAHFVVFVVIMQGMWMSLKWQRGWMRLIVNCRRSWKQNGKRIQKRVPWQTNLLFHVARDVEMEVYGAICSMQAFFKLLSCIFPFVEDFTCCMSSFFYWGVC
jgi:hypothetical protein